MATGITLYQVVAKVDGRTAHTSEPMRDLSKANATMKKMVAADREYVNEQLSEGNDDAKFASFSIFAADADFFA